MKLFIYNGNKYLNTDEQVKFCDSLISSLKKKNDCFYDCRLIEGFIQLVETNKGIETIYNYPYGSTTTFGEYRRFFQDKIYKQ